MAYRKPVQQNAKARARSKFIQPPVRGWITNEPLAASQPGGAMVLENWFPTATSARLRGGSKKYATVSTGPVRRMFTYKSGSQEKLFASDATKIFDISSITDPNTIPAAAVTGQTSGYYCTAQFGTAGGDFLSICNGTDTPKYFDGAAWANHAFTGIASPASLSFVWSFSSRLWYVEKNSMSAWYLPVDSINGALTRFSLAGLFQEGGYLLYGAKWSLDAGDGLDDKCLFISSTGEVAVYEGTDPSSVTTWRKVGVYKITPPLGPNAIMPAGGDLLIATEDGLVPISEAVNKDVAALSISAASRAIEKPWKKEVSRRNSLPWEIVKWPVMNMMVVSLPSPSTGVEPGCFVANLQTGAWTKYTGWDTRCLAVFGGRGYFGSNDGTVSLMETGGNDKGSSYVCTYVALPDHLGSPGSEKLFHAVRSVFTASVPFEAQVSASANYEISLPTPTASIADFLSANEWDVAKWDVAKWDASGVFQVTSKWSAIGASGYVISPQVQVTCGVTPYPYVELVASDALYETGGVMV